MSLSILRSWFQGFYILVREIRYPSELDDNGKSCKKEIMKNIKTLVELQGNPYVLNFFSFNSLFCRWGYSRVVYEYSKIQSNKYNKVSIQMFAFYYDIKSYDEIFGMSALEYNNFCV